jgi:hypothetical protein
MAMPVREAPQGAFLDRINRIDRIFLLVNSVQGVVLNWMAMPVREAPQWTF